MPRFLEEKLKAEYGDNLHAIYGTTNKIDAMRGSKTTAKGRAMQAKHNRDMKRKAKHGRKSKRFEELAAMGHKR